MIQKYLEIKTRHIKVAREGEIPDKICHATDNLT